MDKVIIYLLESSVLLAVFYLLYWLLLRKLPAFQFNRLFLLSALLSSLLIPAIEIEVPVLSNEMRQPIEDLGKARASYFESLTNWQFEASSQFSETNANEATNASSGMNYGYAVLMLMFGIYISGVLFSVSRLFLAFSRINRYKKDAKIEHVDGLKLVRVKDIIGPFSFMNSIFMSNQSSSNDDDFTQIIEHERVHIKQGHSFDLLFTQILASFLWFNPVVWFLIKSLKQTHEFIADKAMLDQGRSINEYQSLLLNQILEKNSLVLAHSFNLSFVKRRIAMMEVVVPGWLKRIRVSLATVSTLMLALIVFQCNSVEDMSSSKLEVKEAPSAYQRPFEREGVALPVVPEPGYNIGEVEESYIVVIKDDKVKLDMLPTEVTVEDINTKYAGRSTGELISVSMTIDGSQKMGLVDEVQRQLQKANARKIFYIGQTLDGRVVSMPHLLPPLGAEDKKPVTEITPEFLAEQNMEELKINLGAESDPDTQQLVYQFVQQQIGNGKNYVVNASYSSSDKFSNYLTNLAYIKEAFNQLYDERANELFGKNYKELRDEQLKAARKGIPMAILVAKE